MKSQSLFIILLLINNLPINAEVSLDGTLGRSGALPGPDYLIGADLGDHQGGNLFHSFQDFNLQSHESATFSGPNNVSNIISRVTGGNSSNIDGLIRSTIPNADMYFLNPYGILFGPNAQLDVQGSFHASTADYLHLGNGGRFDARHPNESLLTVAPIEAFGFLTNTPAPITVQSGNLSVPFAKTLSLIGGELLMDGELPSEQIPDMVKGRFTLTLFAEMGRINLISIASPTDIISTPSGFQNAKLGGKITANNTWVGATGVGGGDIFIRGGDLVLNNSELESDSLNQDSGIIDIQVDNLTLQASEISTDTNGKGQGGKIALTIADTLTLFGTSVMGPSLIISGSQGQLDHAGNGGPIEIAARKITLREGARITSLSEGHGNSGSIVIKASDTLAISGNPDGSFRTVPSNKPNTTEISDGNTDVSGLFSNSRSVEANAGDAGRISVQTAHLKLTDHSIINASAKNAGGGNIGITTSDLLYLRGGRITTSVKSGIGDGGNIIIENPRFVVLNQSKIRANADKGRGGNIRIQSDQFLSSSNSLISASSRLGIDGKIEIISPDMNLDEFLVVLPAKFIDTSKLLQAPCSTRLAENQNRFFIVPSEGTSNGTGDLLPSGPLLSQIQPIKTTKSMTGKAMKVKPAIQLAAKSGCATQSSMIGKSAGSGNRVIPEEPLF
jgi:filamentous hemagglutinin family protein